MKFSLEFSNTTKRIFLLFFFTAIINIAGNENIRFDRLTSQDGLSNNSVTYIFQDSQGFLWFGTQGGLNKYDGYNFKVYKNNPFDTTSLSDNWIQCIAEDKDGKLWIGTYSSGVFQFDVRSGKFINYHKVINDSTSLPNNRVWTVAVDSSNNIWVGTSGGLSLFNRAEKNFISIKNNREAKGKKLIAVNDIYYDMPNVYWLGTWGNGLFKLTITNNDLRNFEYQLSNYQFNPQNKKRSGLNRVKYIHEDENDILWLGSAGGLIKFDKGNNNYKIYKANKSVSYEPNSNLMLSILEDRNGNFWIGTHHEGLLKFDKTTGKFESILNDPLNNKSISGNWITSIYEDRSGILWVGTGNGISKYVPNKQLFEHYGYDPYNKNSLNANEVNCLMEDHDGIVWIGTWGGGLNRFDRSKNKFKFYKRDASNPYSIKDNIIWDILEDKDNNFWIGTYAGLSKFDRKTGRFNNNPLPNAKLSSSNVSVIFEDSKRNFWVGTWGGGLNKYNKELDKFDVYKNDINNKHSISNDLISSIFEDSKGRLWVGTNAGGLNLFNYNEQKFYSFQNVPSDKHSISSSNIRSIYEDSSGTLWIGTYGGGLDKLISLSKENNKYTAKFDHYSEEEGLANNEINGILGYKNTLWIGTNKGLSRFDLGSQTFLNYFSNDGLGIDEFSAANAILKNGDMLFGGTNGITFFNPSKISINKAIPKVVITSFKLQNENNELLNDMADHGEIELGYNKNSFTIKYSALEYSQPSKNQFAYKLDGFDSDWNYVGNKREAQYSNLDPGNYVFNVIASNNDRIWNKTGQIIKISIIPPIWQTFWFKALVSILLILIAVGIYRTRVITVKNRNIKLEAIVQKRTEELQNEIKARKEVEVALRDSEAQLKELNSNKDKFFSIIAHDLKGPFATLLGYSDVLNNEIGSFSPDEIKESLSDMKSAIKKVFKLTQNLLDWSKIQIGIVEYHPEILNLQVAIDQTIHLLEIDFVRKGITAINLVHKDMFVYADKNMLNSIVQNLLYNALKFSYPGGNVKVDSHNKGNRAIVSVTDEGTGMNEETLNKLFKIDVQISSLGTERERGTGLGLILCKDLIEKNGGKIWVESKLGTGTTFSFSLSKAITKKQQVNSEQKKIS